MPFLMSLSQTNILIVTQQPTTTAHGSDISPAITVAFQDGEGHTQTAITANVQVTLTAVSGSGALSGTTTIAASMGVATFSDLVVSLAGTYKLTFISTGLQSVTSVTFTVT